MFCINISLDIPTSNLLNSTDAEIETSQLRETLADHQGAIVMAKKKEKKLAELQNLIAKYDENIDQAMNERMEEATKKIKADADERVRLIEEEKNAAVQRLADIQSKLEVDRRQLEVTKSELFDVSQTATEKVEAKSAEGEYLNNVTSTKLLLPISSDISDNKNVFLFS